MSKIIKTAIVFALVLGLLLVSIGAVFAGAMWDDPCNRGGQCFETKPGAAPSSNAGWYNPDNGEPYGK